MSDFIAIPKKSGLDTGTGIQYSHSVILTPMQSGEESRGGVVVWILGSSLQAEAFRLKPGNHILNTLDILTLAYYSSILY